LPFADWTRRIVQFIRENPDHAFAPFVSLWIDRSPRSGLVLKEMFFAPHFPRFTRHNADAALVGVTSPLPAVDADLLDHYVRFFQRSGFLRTPRSGSLQ